MKRETAYAYTDVRLTLEYEGAMNMLKMQHQLRTQLKVINKEIRLLRCLSREAVLLAKNDLSTSPDLIDFIAESRSQD
jgi:hypothetical protein